MGLLDAMHPVGCMLEEVKENKGKRRLVYPGSSGKRFKTGPRGERFLRYPFR